MDFQDNESDDEVPTSVLDDSFSPLISPLRDERLSIPPITEGFAYIPPLFQIVGYFVQKHWHSFDRSFLQKMLPNRIVSPLCFLLYTNLLSDLVVVALVA